MHIYCQIAILNEPGSCSLATVISARGSTPQKCGCSAILYRDRLMSGTIGGGIVEHSVLRLSGQVASGKKSVILPFELNGNSAGGENPICGGEMKILLDNDLEKNREAFRGLQESLSLHQRGILVTRVIPVREGPDVVIDRYWVTDGEAATLPEELRAGLAPTLAEMFVRFSPGSFTLLTRTEETGTLIFAESVAPSPSLVIAGAGHVGKALAHTGKFLGFEVTVWDDREELANHVEIPEADLILTGTAEEFAGKIEVDPDTYLVIVTRGHSHDLAVLKHFIHSPAAYVGMIGSKAKVARMKEHFIEQGWATPEEWERLHAPVGLPISALTVEEIAVSIAAELIGVKNRNAKRNG